MGPAAYTLALGGMGSCGNAAGGNSSGAGAPWDIKKRVVVKLPFQEMQSDAAVRTCPACSVRPSALDAPQLSRRALGVAPWRIVAPQRTWCGVGSCFSSPA